MDVTTMLERDHQQVEQLFEQFAESQDTTILDRICDELTIHTTIEEQIVYPRLAELDPELARHSTQDHAEAKDLIEQIRTANTDPGALAHRLQRAIEKHVSEEESRVFPLLRENLDAELESMGADAQDRKAALTA